MSILSKERDLLPYFIETGERADETQIREITLFITKDHKTIKKIKTRSYAKFQLMPFLERI